MNLWHSEVQKRYQPWSKTFTTAGQKRALTYILNAIYTAFKTYEFRNVNANMIQNVNDPLYSVSLNIENLIYG